MTILLIRIFTVLLQIIAGILALQLIGLTRRKSVWIFIAAAIFLTALQRSFTYYQLLASPSLPTIEFTTEYLAFYISILMLFGIGGLHPLFKSLNKSHSDLKKSESKYRTLLENLPQSIYLKNNDLMYASCNENFAKDVDIPASKIGGKNDYDLFPPEKAEEIQEDDRRVLEKGEIEERELKYEDRGKTGYRHAIKTPLKNNTGTDNGLLVLYWDITEQKKAELEHEELREKMQQAQKLEGIGVLAGGIAHDFNNLLTGILGNTYLARKELPDGSPVLKGMNEIENAANRAAELTNQMLAYSGQGQYMVKRIDLTEELGNLRNLIEASVSKKAVVEYNIDEKKRLFITADPVQVRQVIVNFVTNASEAIGDQTGRIRISTGVRRFDRKELKKSVVNADKLSTGQYVYLKITDSGDGFDQTDEDKLFEPFYSTKFTGRGLGLAAVLGIVRSQQGAILATSEKGKGSTFIVALPENKEVESTGKQELQKEKQGVADGECVGNVLLVDDEKVVRDVAKRLIEMAGYKVITAPNGPEALKIYKAQKDEIDCVILDMTMPMMNGAEVFLELRKLDSNVRAILSSGYNESDLASRMPTKDLTGFVKKPYNYKKLYSAIGRAISDDTDTA